MAQTEQGVEEAPWPRQRPRGQLLRGQLGDEQCMLDLANNRPEALKPLFPRYAPLVFHMAAQSLDPGRRKRSCRTSSSQSGASPRPSIRGAGAFRPWLMQIAHYRILNELRTRSGAEARP